MIYIVNLILMLIHPALFGFLSAIKEENSRKYFTSIRPLYDDIRLNINEFITKLIDELSKTDPSLSDTTSKECLFRIYRDARRLKEGDLIYKNNFGAHITPTGKKSSKAGYYLHLQSGESFLGGGIYRPTAEQLLKIRTFLAIHGSEYYDIIQNEGFMKHFGIIQGNSLSKLPRGFDKDVCYQDLIMRRQHLIYHHYTDEEVLRKDFFERVIEDCNIAKPFFDLLNTPLS